MEFHFERPKGFIFRVGQFADYTIGVLVETDAEGDTRGFSLGTPFEKNVIFTTRIRDTAFKRYEKYGDRHTTNF